MSTTAATTNYLIERMSDSTVNLCESQGDQWITIARDVDESIATRHGFNLDAPAVQQVFFGG